MEKLTMDNFILDEVVEDVGQTEDGYIYIVTKEKETYELGHGVIDNKYLMYIKVNDVVKILENKKDLNKIKEFIENLPL